MESQISKLFILLLFYRCVHSFQRYLQSQNMSWQSLLVSTVILSISRYTFFERKRLGFIGGILAFLSLGLFAKTFDSGWPTIASFIPLLMGIFVIIESNFELEKFDWKLAILALITSSTSSSNRIHFPLFDSTVVLGKC